MNNVSKFMKRGNGFDETIGEAREGSLSGKKDDKKGKKMSGRRMHCALSVVLTGTYLPTLTSVLGAGKMTKMLRKKIRTRRVTRKKNRRGFR